MGVTHGHCQEFLMEFSKYTAEFVEQKVQINDLKPLLHKDGDCSRLKKFATKFNINLIAAKIDQHLRRNANELVVYRNSLRL